MGKNQNIRFLLVHEACVWTICDATREKKLKADRHTVDVEKGFSAQNLICTGRRSRLTTENQDILLRV